MDLFAPQEYQKASDLLLLRQFQGPMGDSAPVQWSQLDDLWREELTSSDEPAKADLGCLDGPHKEARARKSRKRPAPEPISMSPQRERREAVMGKCDTAKCPRAVFIDARPLVRPGGTVDYIEMNSAMQDFALTPPNDRVWVWIISPRNEPAVMTCAACHGPRFISTHNGDPDEGMQRGARLYCGTSALDVLDAVARKIHALTKGDEAVLLTCDIELLRMTAEEYPSTLRQAASAVEVVDGTQFVREYSHILPDPTRVALSECGKMSFRDNRTARADVRQHVQSPQGKDQALWLSCERSRQWIGRMKSRPSTRAKLASALAPFCKHRQRCDGERVLEELLKREMWFQCAECCQWRLHRENIEDFQSSLRQWDTCATGDVQPQDAVSKACRLLLGLQPMQLPKDTSAMIKFIAEHVDTRVHVNVGDVITSLEESGLVHIDLDNVVHYDC